MVFRSFHYSDTTTTDSCKDHTYCTPTPIAAPTLSGEETARQQNLNHCVIFWPADLKTTMLGCKDVCGTKLANDPAAPDIQASQSCISFNQPWQRADGGMY